MIVLPYLMVVLSSWSLGEAFVLKRKSVETSIVSTSDTPVITLNRCRREPLAEIKQLFLQRLNLQREPPVEGTELSSLREQWKAVFKTQPSYAQGTQDVNVLNSEQEVSGNATGPHCCQLVSQIFIQDLGWENWIIYPESFTLVQCAACTSQLDPAGPRCGANISPQDSPPVVSCCRPASTHLVPVIYLDEFNTLTISTMHLTRECSCTDDKTHPLTN